MSRPAWLFGAFFVCAFCVEFALGFSKGGVDKGFETMALFVHGFWPSLLGLGFCGFICLVENQMEGRSPLDRAIVDISITASILGFGLLNIIYLMTTSSPELLAWMKR